MKQYVLIAYNDHTIAFGVKDFLESHLEISDVVFHACRGYEEAHESLVDPRSTYECLIAWEWLPESNDARNPMPMSGFELAKAYLHAHPTRRAIIISQSQKYETIHATADKLSNSIGFIRQRELFIGNSGLEPELSTSDYNPILLDMVSSALVGQTLAQPTVVVLKLYQDGEECVVYLSDILEGPFQIRLKNSLNSGAERPRHAMGPLSGIQGNFEKATQAPDGGLSGRVIEFSKRIASGDFEEASTSSELHVPPAEKGDLIKRLYKAVHDLKSTWTRPEDSTAPEPVHVHILSDNRFIGVPFDLALCAQGPESHLNVCAPVVWRIFTGHPCRMPQPDVNIVSYKEHRVAFSCRERSQCTQFVYNGLPEVEAEAFDVHTVCGGLGPAVRHFVRSTELRNHIVVVGDTHAGSIHMASHGVFISNTDRSGIVLGPASAKLPNAEIVGPFHLSPGDGESGVRFAYFNCCRLGHQSGQAGHPSSYYGGFLHGILERGVCHEVVCNRWSVSDSGARRMAQEFYRTRPRTLCGRAVALCRARHKLSQESANDVVWLAPIHAVVEA